MRPLTVTEVYNALEKQMLKGNGDKVILVTDDEEGNGYHELWYHPYDDVSNLKKLIDTGLIKRYEADEIVIMG